MESFRSEKLGLKETAFGLRMREEVV